MLAIKSKDIVSSTNYHVYYNPIKSTAQYASVKNLSGYQELKVLFMGNYEKIDSVGRFISG